MIITFTW